MDRHALVCSLAAIPRNGAATDPRGSNSPNAESGRHRWSQRAGAITIRDRAPSTKPQTTDERTMSLSGNANPLQAKIEKINERQSVSPSSHLCRFLSIPVCKVPKLDPVWCTSAADRATFIVSAGGARSKPTSCKHARMNRKEAVADRWWGSFAKHLVAVMHRASFRPCEDACPLCMRVCACVLIIDARLARCVQRLRDRSQSAKSRGSIDRRSRSCGHPADVDDPDRMGVSRPWGMRGNRHRRTIVVGGARTVRERVSVSSRLRCSRW